MEKTIPSRSELKVAGGVRPWQGACQWRLSIVPVNAPKQFLISLSAFVVLAGADSLIFQDGSGGGAGGSGGSEDRNGGDGGCGGGVNMGNTIGVNCVVGDGGVEDGCTGGSGSARKYFFILCWIGVKWVRSGVWGGGAVKAFFFWCHGTW